MSRKCYQWYFDESLVGCSQKGIPTKLSNLIRCMLQSVKSATTESPTEELHTSCPILSQSIMQRCKNTRQLAYKPSVESRCHHMLESPYAVGLSLYMYHNFRRESCVNDEQMCSWSLLWSYHQNMQQRCQSHLSNNAWLWRVCSTRSSKKH